MDAAGLLLENMLLGRSDVLERRENVQGTFRNRVLTNDFVFQ